MKKYLLFLTISEDARDISSLKYFLAGLPGMVVWNCSGVEITKLQFVNSIIRDLFILQR